METTEKMTKLFEDLQKAKKNVRWLLDNPNGLADFHGIAYWAKIVEELSEKIKKGL